MPCTRCRHPLAAHDHYRAGRDCGMCACPRFTRPVPAVLRRWLDWVSADELLAEVRCARLVDAMRPYFPSSPLPPVRPTIHIPAQRSPTSAAAEQRLFPRR